METLTYDAFAPMVYNKFVPHEAIQKNKNLSNLVVRGLAVIGVCVVIYHWRKSSIRKTN